MPAPDIAALFELENVIEPAVMRVLEKIGFKCFDPEGNRLLTVPRVEVELQVGAATGAMVPYGGSVTARAWDCVLIFRLLAKRGGDASGDAQKTGRGTIRMNAQPFAQTFNKLGLPYHAFAITKEQGTVLSIENERDLDISEIHFDAKVSIRNEALV